MLDEPSIVKPIEFVELQPLMVSAANRFVIPAKKKLKKRLGNRNEQRSTGGSSIELCLSNDYQGMEQPKKAKKRNTRKRVNSTEVIGNQLQLNDA